MLQAPAAIAHFLERVAETSPEPLDENEVVWRFRLERATEKLDYAIY